MSWIPAGTEPGMGREEGLADRWRRRARELKVHIRAMSLAARHRRTPWYAKALAALVVGYALSPIDLIPDVIPVLGYLDDLILLPLGIWLTLRLIPAEVWEECQAEARASAGEGRPRSWVAAGVIVVLWLIAVILVIRTAWPIVHRRR